MESERAHLALNPIARIFAQVQQELGLSPTFQALILLIASCRGKPLRLVQRPLRPGLTAFCIALSDADLVCVCADAEEPLAQHSIFHELAHLLLGHLPLVSMPQPSADFLALSSQELDLLYRQHRALCHGGADISITDQESAFTTPQEHAADLLATYIGEYLDHCATTIPPLAMLMWT